MTVEERKTNVDDIVALLAAGELPEMAEALKAEARRRWNGRLTPPGDGYSPEAQRIKMEKDLRKRAMRAAKIKTLIQDV